MVQYHPHFSNICYHCQSKPVIPNPPLLKSQKAQNFKSNFFVGSLFSSLFKRKLDAVMLCILQTFHTTESLQFHTISIGIVDHCWVFIYVNCMQMHYCVWLFVCILCNGQSCPSYLTWGDWFSLDLRALPLTHVVRCNRACTSQTTWSLLQWRSKIKQPSGIGVASLWGIV